MHRTALTQPDTALIDRDFVAQLIEAVGVEEYCMLIGSLTQEVDAQISVIEARAAERETEAVRQSAHRLAGLLSQFGAFQVANVAGRIWETNSLDEIERLVAAMTKLCRASMVAITQTATA
ncbi:MAG: Hpt domain-containing protein [Hyphomicrobiaceae bacterium]